ncbi:ATP-binding protein [Asticcacaulis sp. YBE204]|uniref:ATP-binding protein n=1 Tax=Asticcacaulis sp. YBE204 TaxID=1282363 RepID=UPI0003C3FD4E|nr:ATP-binding protein [Asticcacaulis sp. YBE204]ESQ79202.1 hypothetical protein AEYBE204_09335 [Asticcacaulis sp. YBE204]
MSSEFEKRVLVLAPTSRDSAMTKALLLKENIAVEICPGLNEVCNELKVGAACLVISQEAVIGDKSGRLQATLSNQPEWSDLPVIVLTRPDADQMALLNRLTQVGHMTLIKRPVHLDNFLSTVRAALRDRRRQYRMRAYLLERAESEVALTAAVEKAIAANNAKSEFLANMSHEIRTPMNAILGLSHILARSSPLTPQQQKYISTLNGSGESLLMLINDLLDIAKIEASGIEIEAIAFRLDLLLTETAEMLTPRAHEKGLEVRLGLDHIQGKWFQGDPTRIRQILTNLCGNAVKFTEQGNVSIDVSTIPGEQDGHEFVSISVSDTGSGIEPGQLTRIFDKFTQADNTISRKFGGTGLGLAISKTLAELMHGTITVDSDVGVGTRFTVHLPLTLAVSPGTEKDGVSVKAEEVPETKGYVLLVEDYEPNILVAATLLEGFGYEVDVARNGAIAVESVKARTYAAILMDVQMPVMDGYTATREIRAVEQGNNHLPTPIIGVTAHAMSATRDECIQAGMNDFISKPFVPSDLRKKLSLLIK